MNEFNKIYEQIYLNYYNQLEKMRKNKIYEFILIIATNIMSLIVFYIILVIIIRHESAQNWFALVAWVGTSIIFFNIFNLIRYFVRYLNGRRNDKYTYFFKENVIKNLVNSIENKLEFMTGFGLLESIYIQGEFENFDKYYSEDLIKGILNNGCQIYLAEVRTEWRRRHNFILDGVRTRRKRRLGTTSETHSTIIPIFYGIYANVQLKKNINSFIQLKKNKLINFNSLGDILKTNTTKYSRKKVNMNSQEFDKIYDVFSSDSIMPTKLLTADIMQMLVDFKKQNNIIPEFTLKENILHIRFNTGKMFETLILKKSLDYSTLKHYYDTLNIILKLIENLINAIDEME